MTSDLSRPELARTNSDTRPIPALCTEPPSPTDETRSNSNPAVADSAALQPVIIEPIPQRPGSSTIGTDTESESGYTSTQSNAPVEQEPGRLSVFSRRAASKSSSENDRRTMTIETETVANLYTNAALKTDHHSKGLRGKSSADTVRATQKPKKKKSRIAVVNANHVPTKSEIFAATITQAVDENDDTDSDETFVYESNPRSPKRISRPPSMTSLSSAHGDRRASEPSRLESTSRYTHSSHAHDERDREKLQKAHAISGKRSMKFANNPYEDETSRRHVSHSINSQYRRVTGDETYSTRSPRIRPGLDRRTSSPSSSGPNSPRFAAMPSPRQLQGYSSTSLKRERKGVPATSRPWSLFEDEEEAGSSSERSPFLRKRSSRARFRTRDRQPAGSLMTGMPFIMAIVCLMLVICIFTAAALSTSQPLRDVKVVNITNILVSKQELLFDMVVEAYNPNALAISVKDLEISVFAQSPYVRDHVREPEEVANKITQTAMGLRNQHKSHSRQRATRSWLPWSPRHNNSDGDFPEDEDSTTLLLGRVYEFDNVLQFESRFFNRSVSTASGEIRVIKPGNITDEGGVATWERVIHHSFELIIRGVMRYQSSIFTKTTRTAEIYKTAHINPAKVDAGLSGL